MTHSDAVAIVIGTYTHRSTTDPALGIYAANVAGDELTSPRLVAAAENPSWVAVDSTTGLVFGVGETPDHEGLPQGSVSSYRPAPDGTLELLTTLGTGGADPAHLALTADGAHLVVANYSGGSVALMRVDGSGQLTGPVDLVHHAGSGPHPNRQQEAHPHQVLVDPVTEDILVVDLGIDALVVYRVADDMLQEISRIPAEAGSGPRHAAFHPDGEHLFVVHELDNSFSVFRRVENGFRQESRSSSLAPSAVSGEHTTAAAIRISPNGELVFVSHRWPAIGTVGVFAFEPEAHTLTHLQTVSSRGRTPRDIALTPDGARLLVANQDSNTIEAFGVDYEKRELTHRSSMGTPTPVCIAFVDSAI